MTNEYIRDSIVRTICVYLIKKTITPARGQIFEKFDKQVEKRKDSSVVDMKLLR